MQKERITSPQVFDPAPRAFSNAIRFGSLVFTTAQWGMTPDGTMPEGIGPQTRQSLMNIRNLLETAGTDMEHILKTTVYLAKEEDFEEMNSVYCEFFHIPPARALVVVNGWGDPKRLLEIEAIAGIP